MIDEQPFVVPASRMKAAMLCGVSLVFVGTTDGRRMLTVRGMFQRPSA